jgi:hypothetical protein
MQFTNHTVGRIAPALLTLIISLYFFVRGRGQKASFWLGLYFALLSVFNIGYILGYSVDHPRGGYAWYLACAISFAAAARIQFAYSFPSEFRPREKSAALILAFAASGAALVDYGLRVGSDFGFNLKHPLRPNHFYARGCSKLAPLPCLQWVINLLIPFFVIHSHILTDLLPYGYTATRTIGSIAHQYSSYLIKNHLA